MPPEPKTKRAVSFIDGQNLFRHAKDAFGHHHPNYDPLLLAEAVCARQGWFSQQVRFYTGLARNGDLDVAIVFSQDQDLAEVASEIRDIARSTNRWLKIASAYPGSSTATPRKGIDRTDWIVLDRRVYDRCLDPRDYRPTDW